MRWSDGTISMDPPGPDPASGIHTYVALQTDMDERKLNTFWDERATAVQQFETSRCFVDRVVVAGGNQLRGVQALPIVTARQLKRSVNGESVRGTAVRNRASSYRFVATVNLCWSGEAGEATTRLFTIGKTVFEGSCDQMVVAELHKALSALNATCGEYSAALTAAEEEFAENNAALKDTRAELSLVTEMAAGGAGEPTATDLQTALQATEKAKAQCKEWEGRCANQDAKVHALEGKVTELERQLARRSTHVETTKVAELEQQLAKSVEMVFELQAKETQTELAGEQLSSMAESASVAQRLQASDTAKLEALLAAAETALLNTEAQLTLMRGAEFATSWNDDEQAKAEAEEVATASAQNNAALVELANTNALLASTKEEAALAAHSAQTKIQELEAALAAAALSPPTRSTPTRLLPAISTQMGSVIYLRARIEQLDLNGVRKRTGPERDKQELKEVTQQLMLQSKLRQDDMYVRARIKQLNGVRKPPSCKQDKQELKELTEQLMGGNDVAEEMSWRKNYEHSGIRSGGDLGRQMQGHLLGLQCVSPSRSCHRWR